MAFIKEWLFAIMGASMLSAAAELLMPDSEIKKYTRLAVGLILISIIVRPIIHFDKTKLIINERIFQEQVAAEEAHLGIETVEWRKLDEEFSKRLTELAVKELGAGFEGIKLEAELSYDKLKRVTVSGYTNEQKPKIEKVLKSFGVVDIIWNG